MAEASGYRVGLICKGSLSEGLGHISRTASVARELSNLGAEVSILVIGDSTAANVLKDERMEHRLVASEREVPPLVSEIDPAAVVFDLRTLEISLFDDLTEGRMAVNISPMFEHARQVNLSFSRTQKEPDIHLLRRPDVHRRGLEYAVVTDRCKAIPHSTYTSTLYENPLSIGVSMGGSDAPDKTRTILSAIRQVGSPLLVWVMLGEGYAHSYEALVTTLRKDRRHEVILAKTTQSMWTILGRCNVAVLAGGVTTYEAAYAGLPSINVLESLDDSFLTEELEERGVAITIPPGDEMTTALVSTIERLESDRDELFLMHRRATGLIDGRGAWRIANEIIGSLEGEAAT